MIGIFDFASSETSICFLWKESNLIKKSGWVTMNVAFENRIRNFKRIKNWLIFSDYLNRRFSEACDYFANERIAFHEFEKIRLAESFQLAFVSKSDTFSAFLTGMKFRIFPFPINPPWFYQSHLLPFFIFPFTPPPSSLLLLFSLSSFFYRIQTIKFFLIKSDRSGGRGWS